MTDLLVTLLLLLSDGSPASKAFIQCTGIRGMIEGSDEGATYENPIFVVDSRGAVIFTIAEPITINCTVRKDEERYVGDIKIGPEKVVKVYLSSATDWEE